jgi:hypothetical protein
LSSLNFAAVGAAKVFDASRTKYMPGSRRLSSVLFPVQNEKRKTAIRLATFALAKHSHPPKANGAEWPKIPHADAAITCEFSTPLHCQNVLPKNTCF